MNIVQPDGITFCEICGKEIHRKPSRIKKSKHHYCSRACHHIGETGEGNPNYEGKHVEAECEICGKRYSKRPSYMVYNHFFCGMKCYREWQRTIVYVELVCEECGAKFTLKKSYVDAHPGRRFCSRDCYRKWNTGDNHPGYIDGNGYKGYASDFQKIASVVRKRDRYRCRVCNRSRKSDGKKMRLEVHHIDHDKDNNALDNLITLCSSCHSCETRSRSAGREIWKDKLTKLVREKV